MNEVYTIGHSSYALGYFLILLRKFNINTVVDIRSVPYSKYVPHYNKEYIKDVLKRQSIHFVYMGVELGIIRKDRDLYLTDGFLDFEKLRGSNEYKEGIRRIVTGIEKGYRIGIMCTEKDPIDCHRGILIGRELQDLKYYVKHILENGDIQTQGELEERLLNMYFPNREQQNFFSAIENKLDADVLVSRAYRLRNIEITKRK